MNSRGHLLFDLAWFLRHRDAQAAILRRIDLLLAKWLLRSKGKAVGKSPFGKMFAMQDFGKGARVHRHWCPFLASVWLSMDPAVSVWGNS